MNIHINCVKNMIRGVIVLLRSGLLVAQRGFERTEILTPLMSAAISLSEEIKMGVLKALEYKDYRLYIMTSYTNPEVIIVVAADKDDLAIETRARELVSKIDRVIPSRPFDVVTGELQDSVLRVIDNFLKETPELPSFDTIVNLAKAIYSSLPSDTILNVEREVKEFEATEKADELKKKFVPKKMKVDDPDKVLNLCLQKIYEWNLYDAYNAAYSLRDVESYYDVGSLLAAKIGLIILGFSPDYPSLPTTEVKMLVDVEPRKLHPIVLELVKMEVNAVLEGELGRFRAFLNNSLDKLVEIFDAAEGILKDVYAFLLFSTSRLVLKSDLGPRLINFFKEKSPLLFEILNNAHVQIQLFDILYAPKTWLDIQKFVMDTKLHYMEIKEKYKEILGKSFIQKLFSSWKKELVEVSTYALSAIRPYMLAILASVESYGLSISDREKILLDAYNLVKDDILKIINASPPLDIRTYFDFYQLILHLLMYLGFVSFEDRARTVWNEALEIAREGFKFFYRLYARGRITLIDFVTRVSPIVFIMSKAALNTGNNPKELLYYIRVLANFDDTLIKEMNNRPEHGRFADIINAIIPLMLISKFVPIETLREQIATALLGLLRKLGTWSIHKNIYSREFVDDFADILSETIELSSDRQKCGIFLRDLIDYTNVLVKDPEENRFEAAVMYERAGKLLIKYLDKFGRDDYYLSQAYKYINRSVAIWAAEGYTVKVNELENYRKSLER